MATAPETSKPPMLWAQRETTVFITIPLQDVTDVKVDVKHDTLNFACTVPMRSEHYAVTLELYGEVVPEESHYVARPRQIELKLQKKSSTSTEAAAEKDDALERIEASFWPRLTKNKVKLPFLQVDWSKWKDPEDIVGNGDGEGNDGFLDSFGLGGDGSDGLQLQSILRDMRQEGLNEMKTKEKGAVPIAQVDGSAATPKPIVPSEKDAHAADEDEDDDMPPLEEETM